MERIIYTILFLLLSISANSQQYTFKKATYYFFAPGTTTGSWWRSINQTLTVSIDTVNKTIITPNFQMWETLSSKRNLINGVKQTLAADTSLSVIQPNISHKIIGPLNRPMQDVEAVFFSLEGSVYAALACGQLTLSYPLWNNWRRTIIFSND
jgi:hypothetical protein